MKVRQSMLNTMEKFCCRSKSIWHFVHCCPIIWKCLISNKTGDSSGLLKFVYFGLTQFTVNIRYIRHRRTTLYFFYRKRYFLHILALVFRTCFANGEDVETRASSLTSFGVWQRTLHKVSYTMGPLDWVTLLQVREPGAPQLRLYIWHSPPF